MSTPDRDLARTRDLPEPATLDTVEVVPGRTARTDGLHGPGGVRSSGIVMRKAERDDNGVSAGADEAVAAAGSSPGTPLPDGIATQFGNSLGADLSDVRVHTGAESAAAAGALGARAFATGKDIHFAAGQYSPETDSGKHLLAHEVAHTVQQSGGAAPSQQFKLEVSAPGDAHELEADHAADAMIAGRAATIATHTTPAVSRLFDAYSSDVDLKQLPRAPSYTPADNSFGAMADAMKSSMKGDPGTVPSPAAAFAGSSNNLVECRNNAESSAIYYDHHAPSKWNPFDAGNFNDVYAKIARQDAEWAITTLANVRVAGSATGSWVQLANASNTSWAALVKQAESMSIDVHNKMVTNSLANLDGKQHAPTKSDQEINKNEVGGAGMGLGVMAKQLGIKAPDTSAYKTAMTEYNEARNETAPQQQKIITQLIPGNIASIKGHKKESEDEKEKWETIKQATDTFEKGLTVAFSAGEILEAEGSVTAVGTEGADGKPDAELKKPDFDAKGAAEKGTGFLSKAIDMRINAIQKQIDSYNANLKTYSDVQEAMTLKANIGEYTNGLVKLKNKAKKVESEKARMEAAFKEFGKALDEALIKKGKAPKGSDDNQQAVALFSCLRNATTATQGAVDGLSSGGTADLPTLYKELSKSASDHKAEQTGGDGRRDPRSAIYAIETGRWSSAESAITAIAGELGRRQVQVTQLETEFMTQFANAAGGTDSIK